MHTTYPTRLLPAWQRWCPLLVLSLIWFASGVQAQLLEKKLTASDLGSFREFGNAVAIDGDFAIVGDPEKEAAYLFVRNHGGSDNWGEIKKLIPSYQGGGPFGDDFGAAVAISGDFVLVGAPYTDHSGLWSAGAAYLFARNQGGPDNWGEVKMLTASNASNADEYGMAVGIQNDAAFVSAPFEYRVSGPGYGIDGFVYVYRQHKNGPNQWGQVRKVAPVAPTAAVRFGWSLDVSGDLLLVGAPHQCSPCPQVPGEAFVFDRNQNGPDQWGQVKKILPTNSSPDDHFGYAVALDGSYALIGAQPNGQDGRAYIFERHRGGLDQWGQVRQLAVNDPGNISGRFGYAVALEGEQALVGDPDATVNGVVSQGAVYRFEHNQGGPGQWGQIEKRVPSNLQTSNGSFGVAVDAEGDVFMIGDPSADHGDAWLCGAAFIYWPDPCAEDERPPEVAEVRVEDEKTHYRI
ncbi:MAG TPA: hypothetical protein VKP65_05640, partial [Rhodothermales bacterium]|nr:hypothetical protein [Rhodothermales bacterium]